MNIRTHKEEVVFVRPFYPIFYLLNCARDVYSICIIDYHNCTEIMYFFPPHSNRKLRSQESQILH